MRTVIYIALALVGCSAATMPTSATCIPEMVDYSLRGELAQARYVVAARVLSETWLDETGRPTRLHGHLTFGSMPGGFDPYLGANYRVRVSRVFKGQPTRLLTIFSENSTARTPMAVGEDYLIFVFNGHDDLGHAVLVSSNCGNSGVLRHRANEVRQLTRLIGSRNGSRRRNFPPNR